MDNIYGEDIKKELDKIIMLLERVANALENSNKGKAGIAPQSIEIARQGKENPSIYKHPAFIIKGKEKEK